MEKNTEPIPGYILQERIGAGGCGEVWKAIAPGGLSKAIKFIRGCAGDKWAERELSALELVKKLSHPFLLSLERIEIVAGHLAIVSEMADSSLKERFLACQKEGKEGIPRDELLDYLAEAAEVLDYLLESYSLQHLDVKPENILLVGRHVKLADFGLVKDLNDISASMVTSMTPRYAAPEVFGGRPSRFSDQYSLAIVYCEMATGHAPFTGRTATVLASQHLHAAPDLRRLTRAERVAIDKALAKEPTRRFDNCSELVARLRRRDAASVLIGLDPDCSVPDAAAADPAASDSTELGGNGTETDEASGQQNHDGQTITVPSTTTRSLPPPEFGGKSVRHRPAIFVGIGGTGGRVLAHLRQRLRDRFGEDCRLPSLQFLFIDTDARAVNAAVSGREGRGLYGDDTLLLPLRSGYAYRNMPLGELASISRRWLYTIPRSLRTEGIRAFGRIALLDHAGAVLRRLRDAVSDATSAAAAEATTQATGLCFGDGDPRVFLVASLGGGTGAGMLVDVAYAIRQVLAEAGLADEDVCGLLAYTTARGKTPPCLETGNAYACLHELRYFGLPAHDYPGEPACGLLGFREDRPALPHAYVVEMDGLGEGDVYQKQVGRLASYLFLNALSPAAAFFDACRALERKQHEAGRFPLRTLGLVPLTADTSTIRPEWIQSACRSLVVRWQGKALEPGPHERQRSESAAILESALQTLGCDPEQIVSRIKAAVSGALGRDVNDHVQRMVKRVASRCPRTGPGAALTPNSLLAAVNALLGIEAGAEAADAEPAGAGTQDSLRDVTGAEVKKLADACQECMRSSIFQVAEKGPERLAGAFQAAERLLRRLDETRDDAETRFRDARAKRRESGGELVRLGRSPRCKRRSGFDRFLSRLGEYARLALEEIVCEAGSKMAGLLRSSGKSCLAQLHELSGILAQIREQFHASAPGGDPGGQADTVNDDAPFCLDSAAGVFARHLDEITAQLDGEMQSGFFSEQRRLTDLLNSESCVGRQLVARMRADARRVIIRYLETAALAQLAAALSAGGDPRLESQLDKTLKAMTPGPLSIGGGACRVLLVGPDDTRDGLLEQLQEKLEQVFGEKIAVAGASGREVLLCCEAEQVTFAGVAARLMTSQPDCKELSSRLHTRVDVKW